MKLQNLVARLEKHHKKKIDLSLDRTFSLLKKLGNPLEGSLLTTAYIQLFFYFISILLAIFYVFRSFKQTLQTDSEILTKFTAYIIRSSF